MATIEKAEKGVLGWDLQQWKGGKRLDGTWQVQKRRQKACWDLGTKEKTAKDVLRPGNNRKGGKRRAETWQQ
jgi:hypothetical protein